MKFAIVLLAAITVATAAPRKSNLHFRNLFVDPLPGVKINPSPRIIGGQEAEEHSIPYQAFLEVDSFFSGWYCGGVLLTSKYIITAGHCTYEGETAYIVLGAHRILEFEESQVEIISNNLIVHEGFDMNNILNDIGLIELPQEVQLNDFINTIRLPVDNSNAFVGETIKVSGWGLTRGGGSELSEVLNYVENPAISNEECNAIFGIVEDYQICMSGENGRGSCNGDSGGPATVDGVLVGLVSYGLSGCPNGYPSAFTRTSSFIDWVQANTDYSL